MILVAHSIRFFFLDDITGFEITYLLEVCTSNHFLYFFKLQILELLLSFFQCSSSFILKYFINFLFNFSTEVSINWWRLAAPRAIQFYFHMVCCCTVHSLASSDADKRHCEGLSDLEGTTIYLSLSFSETKSKQFKWCVSLLLVWSNNI